MEKQEFRRLLEKLHDEIEQTDSVDEKGRELLNALQVDIHELLERTEGQHAPPIQQRLEAAIAHLEVEHPALTTALSQLLASLSNAGI